MTRVVCDSGPLTHLWQIGQWRTFRTFDALYLSPPFKSYVRRLIAAIYYPYLFRGGEIG